jgi:hypothetical protein
MVLHAAIGRGKVGLIGCRWGWITRSAGMMSLCCCIQQLRWPAPVIRVSPEIETLANHGNPTTILTSKCIIINRLKLAAKY